MIAMITGTRVINILKNLSIWWENCLLLGWDLVDRGLENKEVLEWACDMIKKPNFNIIKGNHERNICYITNNEEDKCTKNNKDDTLPQIKDISMKDLLTSFLQT